MFSSPEFIKRIKEEDDTMLKHLPILKEINKNEFLTTESQAGRKRSGISKVDHMHYEISERAYITGFMIKSKAIEFIKQMAFYTDKNAIFIPVCSNSVNIPASLDIPLTITKKGDITLVETHASTALPNNVWEMYRKQSHINKTEKIVFILCWDSKWNRGASGHSGLFIDILKILKNINTKA